MIGVGRAGNAPPPSEPFSGVAYRAANGVALGWTRGFAKRQGQFVYHGQPKEVYVYVIEPRLRQILFEDPAPALLTREFLLAQRKRRLKELKTWKDLAVP